MQLNQDKYVYEYVIAIVKAVKTMQCLIKIDLVWIEFKEIMAKGISA